MTLPFNPQSNLPPLPFSLFSSASLTLSFPAPAFGPQFPLPCPLTLSFTSPALGPQFPFLCPLTPVSSVFGPPLPFDPNVSPPSRVRFMTGELHLLFSPSDTVRTSQRYLVYGFISLTHRDDWVLSMDNKSHINNSKNNKSAIKRNIPRQQMPVRNVSLPVTTH